MAHYCYNDEATNHRVNAMRSQIELNAFDPMLVRTDSRLAAPPVPTSQSRLSAVTTDDCPLTCHMPRPQQPPHACCYSSALTLPRRHGNLVSFDLSPVFPVNESVDYAAMTSQSPGQHSRLKLDDEMESRKPLTCPSSATPDVVEHTANGISRQMKFRSVLDQDGGQESQCSCCRSRCGALICVIFAMIILSTSVIATVLIMNEFPSLTSKLIQDGCHADTDCAQFERCLPENSAVSRRLVARPVVTNTNYPSISSTSTRFRCGCWYQCPADYRPVCGSDRNTYHNECQLKLRACHTRANIVVRAAGKCAVSDPCVGVVCPYGGQCIPSDTNGRTAVCRCITDCPLNTLSSSSSSSSSLSSSSSSSAVCGSDGVTYASLCHLQRTACMERVNNSLAYDGACDVCRGHQCPKHQQCIIDPVTGHPDCQCVDADQFCSGKSFDPVCGSNHVTYNSPCHMEVASCELREPLQIAYSGKCKSNAELNGCRQMQCQYGAVCQWNEQQSRPNCVCPRCSPEFAPVCASDGTSYNSECKLRLEACETKQNLRVQYRGLCNSEGNENRATFISTLGEGCEKKHCPNYGICESGPSGEATCVCPRTCVPRKEPVCGIDGVSYANQCEMKVAACNQQKFISIAYHGKCDLCESVVCSDGAVCLAGRCLCPLECPSTSLNSTTSRGDDEGEVCGTDFITYASRCHLEMAACESVTSPTLLGFRSPQLTVRHLGACHNREVDADVDKVPAPSRHTLLCRNIQCQFGATCTVNANGVARCACLHSCHNHREGEPPVCGSDFRLYRSSCHMRKHACLTQTTLHRRPIVLCKRPMIRTENNEELCLGMEPLRNTTSNKIIQCAADNYCPSGTFCHRTANTSACCSVKLAYEHNKMSDTPKNTTGSATNISACSESLIGCCPDGVTTPPGGDIENCPVSCNCHRLGALRDSCDANGLCECRPGVSGIKCDRCAVNHWGLQKIEFGHTGCEPCRCNIWGSVRLDCEQSRGRCVCRSGISGDKCDICTDGSQITDEHRCHHNDNNTMAAAATTTRTSQPEEHFLVEDGVAAFSAARRKTARSGWHSPLADQAQMTENDRQSHFTPAFTNQSYMELRSLRTWLHLYLEIEVLFRNADGLILYHQPWPADNVNTEQKLADAKPSNAVQYMYLALVDGYIVFSYNLGYGPIGLKTRDRISLNQYHRILVRRYHSDGQLVVDDGEPIVTKGGDSIQMQAQPKLPVYIGFAAQQLRQNRDLDLLNVASAGFVGCVRRLRMDQSQAMGMVLDPTVSSDVTVSHLVSNCRLNECQSKNCQSDSSCGNGDCSAEMRESLCRMDGCNGRVVCQENSTPQCICPANRWGNYCNKGIEKHSSEVPSFSGDGFLQMKQQLPLHTPLSVEVWFLTRKKDGIVLFVVSNGLSSDSILVQLQNYKLSATLVRQKSSSIVINSMPIKNGVWHRTKLHVENDRISLTVDGMTAHSVVSPTTTRGKHSEHSLTVYLGGQRIIGAKQKLESHGVAGMDGAIQMVRLAGRTPVRNLLHASLHSLNVNKFEGLPCGPTNPCKNGGTCTPRLNRFICHCTERYSGRRCQKREASSKRKRKLQ